MRAKRLRDLMPKRHRRHESLPEELNDRVIRVYQRLGNVPFIQKQPLERWSDRFCYSPNPQQEIAVWEWLAGEYEQRTVDVSDQGAKNRIFRELLTEAVDYEPLGVRKLPE